MSAPQFPRCTEARRFGDARHGNTFQCKLPDPHPETGHDFGIDAEVYGRDLNIQRPEWLAATLRDAVARQRHLQRRLEELQAVTLEVARDWGDSTATTGWAGTSNMTDRTVAWLRANAPAAAKQLGLAE